MELDDIVQLHESIRIIYTVTDYTAYLYIREEAEEVLRAKGSTPQEALNNLAAMARQRIPERWWKK